MLTQRRYRIAEEIIRCRGLVIRDIAAGEEPFLYSSGNKGPGYLMIKGLVSQRTLMHAMANEIAEEIASDFTSINYVSGNATGGMIPGWVVAGELGQILGREVPFCYLRGTRKIGGHGEYITGNENNPMFKSGCRGIVVEELVNFAQTTVNSALVQRGAGYDVQNAATFVTYDHAPSQRRLADNGVQLRHLLTVSDILDIAAKGQYDRRLVEDYRAYLADPVGWQIAHGITPPNPKE